MKRIGKFIAAACGAALLAGTLLAAPAVSPGSNDSAQAAEKPGQVTGLQRKNENGFSTKIDLKWKAPDDVSGKNVTYEIRYWPYGHVEEKKIISDVTGTGYRVENLKPHVKYRFKVRAKVDSTFGEWSDIISKWTYDALRIDMLYAGKGDAILIKLPNGKTALLDGGVSKQLTKKAKRVSYSKSGEPVDKFGDDDICSILKKLGVTTINYYNPLLQRAG